jgi:hypothetical protein
MIGCPMHFRHARLSVTDELPATVCDTAPGQRAPRVQRSARRPVRNSCVARAESRRLRAGPGQAPWERRAGTQPFVRGWSEATGAASAPVSRASVAVRRFEHPPPPLERAPAAPGCCRLLVAGARYATPCATAPVLTGIMVTCTPITATRSESLSSRSGPDCIVGDDAAPLRAHDAAQKIRECRSAKSTKLPCAAGAKSGIREEKRAPVCCFLPYARVWGVGGQPAAARCAQPSRLGAWTPWHAAVACGKLLWGASPSAARIGLS